MSKKKQKYRITRTIMGRLAMPLLASILLGGFLFIHVRTNAAAVAIPQQTANPSPTIATAVADQSLFRRIFFVGDSLTAGVGASDIAHSYPYQTISMLRLKDLDSLDIVGRTGDVLQAVSQSVDLAREAADADLVVVELGTNDFYEDGVLTDVRPTRLDVFQEQYNMFLDTIRTASPHTKIACIGIWAGQPSRPNALGLSYQLYNQVIAASCSQYQGQYVAIDGIFNDPKSHSPQLNKYHPNDYGYQKIAAALALTLELHNNTPPVLSERNSIAH